MKEIPFDIVICGGSFSAPAVALEAARANPNAKILLTEPTDWLGGQSTSQGVSAIDNAWHEPGRSLMANNPSDYYPADYLDFLNRLKNPDPKAPGIGYSGDEASWVTREAFDPRTAAWILDQMVSEHPQITLMKSTVVKRLETTEGETPKILSITFNQRTPVEGTKEDEHFLSEVILDWYDTSDSSVYTKKQFTAVANNKDKGLVVVDSSELGDVIVLSGAKYTIGREQEMEECLEDGSIPSMDEDGTQAMVYVFCMGTSKETSDEPEALALIEGYDDYIAEQNKSFYGNGPHSWEKIWTYRRLKNTGKPGDNDAVNLGDVSMQNWYPGNDYPYGSILKDVALAETETTDWQGGIYTEHLRMAEIHAIGWYFWMKERKPVEFDTRYAMGDNPDNFMDTKHGLAKFPYIRGTRRIIGLENYRLTGRYLDETTAPNYDGKASYRFFDSVGIGSYAVDVHPTNTSKGILPPFEKAAPFYVPYRALASHNVPNLLVAGKLIATTYVTNAAYRLHPIEWVIGSAVGSAAARMAETGLKNSDLYKPEELKKLQQQVAKNSPIHWKAYDDENIKASPGDLIINGREPLTGSGETTIEAFTNLTGMAVFYQKDRELAKVAEKINGRFVAKVALDSTNGIRVEILNDGKLAGTMTE